MKVILSVVSGPHRGRSFEFVQRDHFLVGRSSKAHFRLPQKDPYFSRAHFVIEVNPPLCRLLDLQSTNGTSVNGTKVDIVNLKHGDQIAAGDTVFQLTIDAAESPPVRPFRPDPVRGASFSDDEFERTPRGGIEAIRTVAYRPPLSPTSTPDADQVRATTRDARNSASPQPPAEALPRDWQKRAAAMPQPISGYRLIDELGRGAMGVVYRAVREADRHVVAIKTIIPAVVASGEECQRFLREAEILSTLDHPHIVRCIDQGEQRGTLFFVMEFVQGTDSKRLTVEQGPLEVRRAVVIAQQLCDALEYAHRRGYVHRDIKPSNVLLVHTASDFVKLADFGLARTYQTSKISGLTQLGTLGGTVPFMPPEQITQYRDVTPASDQYSAAATLYYLLTGRQVYNFAPHLTAQLSQILTEDPVPIRIRRPDLPPELAAVIHRAMARETSARYPTISEFQAALIAATQDSPPARPRPPRPPRPPRQSPGDRRPPRKPK